MDTPKPQSKRSLLNSLNKDLNKIPSGTPLQDWIDQAAKIIPNSKCLEGFYCGRDGNIKEEVDGLPFEIYLIMGWHTVDVIPRVEYAYFS